MTAIDNAREGDGVAGLPYAESLAKWCEKQADDPDNKEGVLTLLTIAEVLREADKRLAAMQAQQGAEPVAVVQRGHSRAHVVWIGRKEESVPDGAKLYLAPAGAP